MGIIYAEYFDYCQKSNNSQSKAEKFMNNLSSQIIPFEMQTLQSYVETFNSRRDYEIDKQEKRLQRRLDPGNRYPQIRNQLMKNGKFSEPQSYLDAKALKLM